MDTLSSSVSTLKAPTQHPPTNREFYLFRRTPYATPNLPSQLPQPHVSSSSSNSKHNFVPKTKPFSQKYYSINSLPFSSSKASPSPLKPKSHPIFHENPATGYAAAVIDVSQSSNSLHSVHRDVKRLLKFLQNLNFQSSMVEELQGNAVRRVIEQANFHRHVVALLKMLVKKNRVGIVQEVLEEFERIYDELCGTQMVLVSSQTKMEEDELFGIAKRVQQLSGAMRVKVRNLVQQNSFAV